jgi:hypothetical protein
MSYAGEADRAEKTEITAERDEGVRRKIFEKYASEEYLRGSSLRSSVENYLRKGEATGMLVLILLSPWLRPVRATMWSENKEMIGRQRTKKPENEENKRTRLIQQRQTNKNNPTKDKKNNKTVSPESRI